MIPGAVYLGCFLDEPGERTMDVMAYKSKSSLTNEVKIILLLFACSCGRVVPLLLVGTKAAQ